MTISWPLWALTTLSDSRIWLKASGSVSVVRDGQLGDLRRDFADGRVDVQDHLPSSSICGVTSSATPEKNGVSSTLLVVGPASSTVLLVTPVTKTGRSRP